MSVTILPKVQIYLTQYGMSTCLFLGVVGNTLIILVLKKKNYNTCSIYISTAAFLSTIFLCFNVPLLIYASVYKDPTVESVFLCKLRYFGLHVVGQWQRYLIVLACIDRYAVTSPHARLRLLSQPKIARNIMIATGIVLLLCAIHVAIFTTIQSGRCFPIETYYNIYLAYIIIFSSTIPPLAMAVFGYLAFRNINFIRARVQAATNNPIQVHNLHRIHRRDHDLSRMILAEVFVYVLTQSGYPIILTEMAITSNISFTKSVNYQVIENFILYLTTFIGYLNNAAAFYIYLVASKSFRQHVLKMFQLRNNQIVARGT